MANRRSISDVAFAINLLSAVVWLVVCGLTWLDNSASLVFGGGDLRVFVVAPVCAVAAVLWAMLATDALIRPRARGWGRWFMMGIAIALLVGGWTLWLGAVPCFGAVATTVTLGAVGLSVWSVVVGRKGGVGDAE